MARRTVPLADLLSQHRLHRLRSVMRVLPSNPRCKLCNVPFRGVGRLVPVPAFRPSSLNPNLCRGCFESLPLGGVEMDIGVLFVDVRGYTSMAEQLAPTDAAERLDRFYKAASDVIVARDGLVDKLAGDQVMALFLPLVVEGDACEQMVAAGEDLLAAVDWLPLGAGADFGTAFVGNVGPSELAKDFTALGDVVNTAERLEAAAAAGQLVLSERVWSAVAERAPDAERVELELKGKSTPVVARIVRPRARTA